MGTSLVQGQVILFISPDGMLGRVELKNETSDENDHQKNNIEQKMQKCQQITKGVCKGLRDHCDKKKNQFK